jgi:hypothetical protein
MQDTPISKKGSMMGNSSVPQQKQQQQQQQQHQTYVNQNAVAAQYMLHPQFQNSVNVTSSIYESPMNLENSMNNQSCSHHSLASSQSLSVSRISKSIRQSINVDNLIKICTKKLETDPNH